MSTIVIRPFNASSDSGFIYTSIANQYFYFQHTGLKYNEEKKQLFFDNFKEQLSDFLNKHQISIACLDEDHDKILGCAIMDGTTLEYVYVRAPYREQGIARFLLKNKIIYAVNEKNITHIGKIIMEELNIFTKKEEPNEIKATPSNKDT